MITATVDTTKLNAVMQRYVTELGFAATKVVRSQAGLLMRDLVNNSPPKTPQKGVENIRRDVRKKVMVRDQTDFSAQKRGKKQRYLYASPKVLAYVEWANDATGGLSEQRFRAFKRQKPAWTKVGRRGKQVISRLNKLYTLKKHQTALIKSISQRLGKFKASFAVGWDKLRPHGRRPAQWIMRHVGAGTAPGAFIDFSARKGLPSITIISNARGVERENSIRTIKAAVAFRMYSMLTDIKLYLNGTKKKAQFAKS